MLAIYHWEPNANSGKPLLAAAEKGVAFESHYVDLIMLEHQQPEYLAVNPQGTIPAMIHDGVSIPESTAMMEYIDEAFDGPPLRPSDPFERWRMRWWCRYFDMYFGPSVSQHGWKYFVGPAARERDRAQIEVAIERLPLPERRASWRKAIYGQFSDEEMAESRRRLIEGGVLLEKVLSKRRWLAGDSYSIADMVGFNMGAGVWAMVPEAVNEEKTPHVMEWFRTIGRRPAVSEIATLGRVERMKTRIPALLDTSNKGAANA